MVKKLFAKLKGEHIFYRKACKKPILEKAFLLEAGQGKNINGNMFAIARELCTNMAWQDFTVYWVVTEDTRKSAQQRFAFYGYKVQFVERLSKEYCELLATCKYLLTDNSFPPFLDKRDNQIYLNTWHGTPLKTLGKSDIKNAKSLANIQKNYLMADYALFPNELTKNVFMKDYMLEKVFSGKLLMCDYPRNSILLDTNMQSEIRKKLNLEDKQLIAYMPTWRGSDRTADAMEQKQILDRYFKEIDAQLQDHQIFYVNLHFLVGNTMDFTSYTHIKPFPKEYETYDFLGVCDQLVTDYSSVFFDYAVTKKKIILFAYDYEEYMESRGTYFSMDTLPFPIVRNVNDLIREINTPDNVEMSDFLSTFCKYRNPFVPEMVVDLLVHQEKKNLHIYDNEVVKQDVALVYVGNLKKEALNYYLLEQIKHLKQELNMEILLCFRTAINEKKIEFLTNLPEGIDYLALVKKYNFTLWEQIKIRLSLSTSLFRNSTNKILQSERNRFFYHVKPSCMIDYSGKNQYMNEILKTFACPKTKVLLPEHFNGTYIGSKLYKTMIERQSEYEQVLDQRKTDVHKFWEEKELYYNASFQMANLYTHFSNRKDSMKVYAIAIMKQGNEFPLDQIRVEIADKQYQPIFKKKMSFHSHSQIVSYSFVIPNRDIREFEIQNKINFVYTDHDGYGFKKGTKYNAFHLRKGKNKQGPIQILHETETSAYFRQSKNNVLYLTVRKQNITDGRIEQLKLNLAYWISKFYPNKKIILLFEKESSRYEESASVLYEKLMDEGYTNAYFIIDRRYSHFEDIPQKYRSNLIYKGTFKHYLYFFVSKTFLGSEALVHAIDLRISNKHALDKINDKTLDYVFLQHGVMYMVSLDSESRKFFKPMKTDGKYRVVTSSVAEAKHFVELGGYDPETIYVCGLPKFDRNTIHEDADKIVIMPTWRHWEYNEARYDFESTKYYQMICRIVQGIPEELKDKLMILPHPLFFDAIKNSEFELKKYLNDSDKYDDILKQTRVLITDYSSIAYDAFYRGCNVIFYWEEKDECMENYGPSTKLMLNESNVYGDVCMDFEELRSVIEKNYYQGQEPFYQERYSKLVDYHDGKNTERLVSMLKKDQII